MVPMMAASELKGERRLRLTQKDIELLGRALAYYIVHGIKPEFEMDRYIKQEGPSNATRRQIDSFWRLLYRLRQHNVGRVGYVSPWLWTRRDYERFIKEIQEHYKV